MGKELEKVKLQQVTSIQQYNLFINVIFLTKGNIKYIKNYTPSCLLSNINKLFRKTNSKKRNAANTTYHSALRSRLSRKHLTLYKPKQY